MKLSYKEKKKRARSFGEEAEKAQRAPVRKKRAKIKLPKLKTPKMPKVSTKAVLYGLIILAVMVTAAVAVISSISEKSKEKIPEPEDIIKNTEETEVIDYDAPTMKDNFTYDYYRFPSNELVECTEEVKILSFGSMVAYPDRAFGGNSNSAGTDERSLTPSEFQKILKSLYDNGYILVNLNDLYTEEGGEMKKNTLLLPKDRKPLVLIFSDMCFYDNQKENGTIEKIAINREGLIRGLSTSNNGRLTYSRDLDPVSLLDMFVEQHPDFSFNGAKGCIALTGYSGVLGYRTQSDFQATEETNRQREIAYAKPVIQLLKKTGWYFACSTYGDIDLVSAEYAAAVEDMAKWVNEVGSLVGETKIFVYPKSSSSGTVAMLSSGQTYDYLLNLGFTYFVGGAEASSVTGDGTSAIPCQTASVNGFSLRWRGSQLTDYFIAADVFDTASRPNLGTNFSQSSESGTDAGSQDVGSSQSPVGSTAQNSGQEE